MATINNPPPKNGVIFRRYRKVRGGKILDAHDYGYEAWPIPIRRQFLKAGSRMVVGLPDGAPPLQTVLND